MCTPLSVKRIQGCALCAARSLRESGNDRSSIVALATLIRQDVGNLSHRRAGAARNSTMHPLR